MENFLKTQKTYTVLELNNAVHNLLKTHFPGSLWVCGEIQGLRPERNKKHTYFELVQKHHQASEIIAKVKVALFAGRKPLIAERIAQTKGAFQLKNDIEVKFLCQVSLHPPTGQYSLIVIDIDPVYTLGKVAQNRLRIIEELRKENLLEKNKMLKPPDLPLRIGLITALDSAAYHDFINELATSGYGFKVLAVNSYMQGRNLEADVVGALAYLGSLEANLDVIVITRGGGSRADLAWFDNKNIAVHIAGSPLPVLSALGHQTDISITDMVAHTSFKTPTKVAQFLVQTIDQAQGNLQTLGQKILEGCLDYLAREKQNLRTRALVIDSGVSQYFRDHLQNLAQIKSQLSSLSLHALKSRLRLLFQALQATKDYFKRTLQEAGFNVKYIQSKLQLLDPRTILKRGYSITLKDNRPIKSINQLKSGDIIQTNYWQGQSISKVKELKKDD